MPHKQLWVLAGGNGSGKSTFFELFLAPRKVKLINADIIAREIDRNRPEEAGYTAAAIAERIREDLLDKGINFCYETVFSHVSKIDFVTRAKLLGYEVILVFIHLDSPELNEARVYQRVKSGGNNVPVEKIYSRIPRTFQNIKLAIPLADETWLLNNSSFSRPFQVAAIIKKGSVVKKAGHSPEWVNNLLE